MSPDRIKELEQKFYDECTDRITGVYTGDLSKVDSPKVDIPPHDVFQWFVENFKSDEKVLTLKHYKYCLCLSPKMNASINSNLCLKCNKPLN